MDYYDGNTVTALWNYAQRFAMSDNTFGTTFGPSTPGALNLVSGQTGGVNAARAGEPEGEEVNRLAELRGASRHDLGDPIPGRRLLRRLRPSRCDDRPERRRPAQCSRRHLGLVPGRLRPDLAHGHGTPLCGRPTQHRRGLRSRLQPAPRAFPVLRVDGQPAAPAPSSVDDRPQTGQANHQYDLPDFYAACAGNLPAVSFLKAAKYQDGHAGDSDPLDEQAFLTRPSTQQQPSGSSPPWSSPGTTRTAGTTTSSRRW